MINCSGGPPGSPGRADVVEVRHDVTAPTIRACLQLGMAVPSVVEAHRWSASSPSGVACSWNMAAEGVVDESVISQTNLRTLESTTKSLGELRVAEAPVVSTTTSRRGKRDSIALQESSEKDDLRKNSARTERTEDTEVDRGIHTDKLTCGSTYPMSVMHRIYIALLFRHSPVVQMN